MTENATPETGMVPASPQNLQASTPAPIMEMTVDDVVKQLAKIDDLVKRVMVEGVHYGTIPGTKKPTLLQPGAQTLNLAFRLLPRFETQVVELGNGPRDYRTTCTLWNPMGQFMGSGEGSCSTMEKKYRWRMAELTCPACGKTTVRKSRDGGWYCWAKLGGCAATWPDGAAEIEKQERGMVENPDIADVWNTCKKMSCKRALVAATINVLAVSDKFTQDMEDMDPAAVAGTVKTEAKAERVKAGPAVDATAKAEPAQAVRPAQPVNGNGDPATDAQIGKIDRELARVGMEADEAISGAKLDGKYAHTKKGASELIGWILKQPGGAS